jgi:poly-beta-1,6-N-acetyl-D-glucosamine synthase
MTKKLLRRRRLALLLPGHNEELIIATTIRSAVAAGQPLEDIYVVDDASSDRTRQEAIKMLPAENILTVEHSGKAMAVKKAISYFKIEQRYVWLHVADADSVFGPDYFRIYRSKLQGREYAVAVGFVQSLRGNWISRYRAFCYTYSQHVMRRLQAAFGMISVFPGPITCFRTDIIKHLDFVSDSFTEDFDITLQVHRKKLGKIRFIPRAVNYTQDPQTLGDFTKQTLRWQRGFFQGILAHKIGTKVQPIDMSIMYQLVEVAVYLLQLAVLLPTVAFVTGQWWVVGLVFLVDFLIMAVTALISSAVIRRPSIMLSLPLFYILRWVELGVFLWAMVEVVILRKFRTRREVGWSVKGRRYQISADALQDVAN